MLKKSAIWLLPPIHGWHPRSQMNHIRSIRIYQNLTEGLLTGVYPYAEYLLPGHKADPFFEGDKIVIQHTHDPEINPLRHFFSYLVSRDRSTLPIIWTCNNSIRVPNPIQEAFPSPSTIAPGHSLRSGGVTDLALNSVPNERIWAIGRLMLSKFW